MKRKLKKMTGSLLVAGLLVTGLSAGAKAYAAGTDLGTTGASSASNYSVNEILVYAIEDEYLAQAEYNTMIEKFGVQRPFSNIIKAEATHINLLTPLFEEYGATVPNKDWASLVTVPESLAVAYETGITS